MKIKNVLLGFLAVMMLLVTVAGAMALDDGEIVGSPGDFDEFVAVDNDKILAENLPEVPFWKKIFGQSFSFVSIEVDEMNNYACSLDSPHGSFDKPAYKQIRSGSQCDSGQFIAYRSDGGDITSGHYLFDNLWLKKSSTDLPEFQNYWVNDKSFDYSYACYDCQVSVVDDFEPGCLTKDKTDCVKKSDSSCGTWYGYEKVCLQHVQESSNDDSSSSSDPVKITLNDIRVTNDGDLTLNQKYTVSGKAYIDGECDDCVIETGQGYYGTKQSFSIFSNEEDNNACGDDLTVGIKFDAEDEWIDFKIYDIATKKGIYEVEIGAYNGCYKDLEDETRKLDSEKYTIEVVEASSDEPEVDDDQSNDVTCYFCMSDELMSGTYDDSCPDGTFEDEIECGAPSEPDCTNDPDSEACNKENPVKGEDPPINWSDGGNGEVLPKLSWTEEYFDFENNPKTAYSLVAIGVIVLILIIAILASTGKKRR